MDQRNRDDGFTLIEVLLATALFVFVAAAGFEVLRHMGGSVTLMAQRADTASQLSLAAASLRSDALSSVSIWKPASACGDAVEFMQRDAGGTSFVLYEVHANAFVRAAAAGPMDPCDDALQRQTLVTEVAAISVTRIAAPALAAHLDPITGSVDGAVFAPAGVTGVAVDAHALDRDTSPIVAGNDVVEVTLDAQPVVTPVDLVAGNRPSAYTHVLAYTCNGRCEAAARFPELRGAAFNDCTPGYDFQNTAAYYVPAAFGIANQHTVVTAYTVAAGYTFAFAGAAPIVAERAWPPALWAAGRLAAHGNDCRSVSARLCNYGRRCARHREPCSRSRRTGCIRRRSRSVRPYACGSDLSWLSVMPKRDSDYSK